MAKYFLVHGHQVLLISECPWSKERPGYFFQAKSIMLLKIMPFVYKPLEIIEQIAAFNPDIIHYHWPSSTMDFLFRLLKKYNVPILITIHVAVSSFHFILD